MDSYGDSITIFVSKEFEASERFVVSGTWLKANPAVSDSML